MGKRDRRHITEDSITDENDILEVVQGVEHEDPELKESRGQACKQQARLTSENAETLQFGFGFKAGDDVTSALGRLGKQAV